MELDKDKLYIVSPYGLGDTMILFGFMKELEKRYASSIVYVIKPSHKIVAELFGCDNYILSQFTRDELIYTGKMNPEPQGGKMWVAHPEFSNGDNLIREFMTCKISFVDMYRRFLGIPGKCHLVLPSFYPEHSDEKRLADEVINEKTILLAPDMNASDPNDHISKSYYDELILEYNHKGLKVIINSTSNEFCGKYTNIGDMDIRDLIFVAKKCGKVISARSGLCDLLAPILSNLRVVYPNKHFYEMYNFERNYDIQSVEEIVYEK